MHAVTPTLVITLEWQLTLFHSTANTHVPSYWHIEESITNTDTGMEML
jgi:hypothetical protein